MGVRLGLRQGKGWREEECVSCTRLEDDVRRKCDIEGRHLDRLLKRLCRITHTNVVKYFAGGREGMDKVTCKTGQLSY